MNFTGQNPPAQLWYAAKSPGLSLQCRSSRAHQTAFAHLGSGHLRGMTFVHGVKSFFICPYSLPASPAHLLDCWGIYLRQAVTRVMTFVHGVKSFFICPYSLPASPAHLLDCWGIYLRQLFEDQDLVCDIIVRKRQMDLV
ncbi:uncharacterized protein TNCV_3060921 [Trichonephila clavipes]|nr:uncharacterized protein TNCV_3060921 [Trichonephila clavipes]